MLEGTIIKESLSDDFILDKLSIKGVEIWKADNHTPLQPKYWTAIFFETKEADFIDILSDVLKEGWYVDLRNGEKEILVFKHKVIEYNVNDVNGKKTAMEYCRHIGIPESQIDW